jgi:hypothetical protein
MTARRPCRFTRRDLTRAIRAVVAAGVRARVEVDMSGKIIVVIAGDERESAEDSVSEPNPWDTHVADKKRPA